MQGYTLLNCGVEFYWILGEVDEFVALFDSRVTKIKQPLDVAKNRVSVLITTMNDFDVHSKYLRH